MTSRFAPRFNRHVNHSSITNYKITWMKLRRYLVSTVDKRQYTIFKFKSTDINLLSCLACLYDKMVDSTLWLVRPPVSQTPGKGSIEMVWDELEKQPTNTQHLWEIFQDCWKAIPDDYLMMLTERMPSRGWTCHQIKKWLLWRTENIKHILLNVLFYTFLLTK